VRGCALDEVLTDDEYLAKWQGHIKNKAVFYARKMRDYELISDFTTLAYMALFRVKPELRQFKGYVATSVKNAMVGYIAYLNLRKRIPKYAFVTEVDEETSYNGTKEEDNEGLLANLPAPVRGCSLVVKQQVEHLLAAIIQPEQRQVIHLLLLDYNNHEMATEMGLTIEYVCGLREQAIRRMRQFHSTGTIPKQYKRRKKVA
jgi:DNA-directed RNA polymerase specialized sigma24 family protein